MMASQNQTQLDSEDISRRANELVYLMLIRKQSNVPVKRPDIVKYVLKENKTSYNIVLQAASEKLSEVFGMELVEIGEGSKKAYILKNKLDHLIVPGQDEVKRGLLMIVLTLIYMSGNCIEDGRFWHALKKLGIDPGTRHPEFGDVKKLIMTEFARQMYLDVTRTPGSDPAQYTIQWGSRAYQEVTKLKLLEFVSELYGKSDISVWKSQYRDATS